MLRNFTKIVRLSILIFIFVLLTGCIFKPSVEDLTIDQTEVITFVTDEVTLVATVLPIDANQRVQWSSSDEEIATVKDGVITSFSNGEAIITAKAGLITTDVKVTVHNWDSKDLLEAIDDSNFINYQMNINVKIWTGDQYGTSSSKVYVDNNKTETQSDDKKIYSLFENNTIYVATPNYYDIWDVETSKVTEESDAINEQLILSVDDFTKSGDYYTLIDSKAVEYADIINDYMQIDAAVLKIENLIYKIKVTNKKIRQIVIYFKCRMSVTNGYDTSYLDFALNMEMSLINYGSVHVDIPEKVMDAINYVR